MMRRHAAVRGEDGPPRLPVSAHEHSDALPVVEHLALPHDRCGGLRRCVICARPGTPRVPPKVGVLLDDLSDDVTGDEHARSLRLAGHEREARLDEAGQPHAGIGCHAAGRPPARRTAGAAEAQGQPLELLRCNGLVHPSPLLCRHLKVAPRVWRRAGTR